jgi:hypothetical protein
VNDLLKQVCKIQCLTSYNWTPFKECAALVMCTHSSLIQEYSWFSVLNAMPGNTCGVWSLLCSKVFRHIVTEWHYFSLAVTLFTYTSMWISQSPPNFTVLGLSLTHCYPPWLTGFITVSFPTKTRRSSLSDTVREPTHTYTWLPAVFIPTATPAYAWPTPLFSRVYHYHSLHTLVTFQSYIIIRAKEQTSHAVRVLMSTTITWVTEPC